MNKVKHFLKSANTLMVLLVLIAIRVAIKEASIGDALVVTAICAVEGLSRWIANFKDIEKARAEAMKPSEELVKEVSEIKSHMSAILIKNTMRPTTVVPQTTEPKKFF